MTNYRLMMLDLDGTIIGRDNKISPRVHRAVTRAAELLHVSIATGRETDEVLKFARELGLKTPQVSDNGATIVDPETGRHVWSAGLSPEHSEEIVARLTEMRVPFMATSPFGTIKSIGEVVRWELTRVSALDISEAAADGVLQAFSGTQGLHMVKVYLPYNDLWAVDFTRIGITKGASADVLREMMGYGNGGAPPSPSLSPRAATSLPSRERADLLKPSGGPRLSAEPDILSRGAGRGESGIGLIAAGDSYNDIQMLRAADLRIVMGGAPAEVKALADYVAPPVEEDGLAVAIEEFVLPRL